MIILTVLSITGITSEPVTVHLVQSGLILNDNVVQLVSQDFSEHPEKYTVWKAPAIWTRGTDLVQSIDVIMHLLFLGVVKTVVISLDEWLKLRGKSERFLSCACYLSAVSELQLSWCEVIIFSGGKMAG